MRTIIPSWARPTSARTHKLIEDGSYVIVVHDNEARKWYGKNETIDPAKIVVSGLPYGNSGQRNFILDHVAQPGEWFIMADDNIDGLSAVEPDFYFHDQLNTDEGTSALWRKRYGVHRNNMTWAEFVGMAIEDVKEAEKRGAMMIGYATNTNPFFRKRKYRDVGYVSTKLAVIKNTHLRCDPQLMSKVDYDFTAAHLAAFGRVLINNFIYPIGRHFEPGGIGTVRQRTPMNLFGCDYLTRKYPGLFRYHDRAGRADNSEIAFVPTSAEQVSVWREGFLSRAQGKS